MPEQDISDCSFAADFPACVMKETLGSAEHEAKPKIPRVSSSAKPKLRLELKKCVSQSHVA
jgi:hypothetical protein